MSGGPPERLHVVQLGLLNDPERRGPRELLEAWPTLVDVAEAAGQAPVRVSVVQACVRAEVLDRAGVRYHFLPFDGMPESGGLGPLLELLRVLRPDVMHVHGLDFPRQVLALSKLVPTAPIILQDHASRPPPIWRRGLWRRGLAAAAAVSFCAAEQARAFVEAGLLGARTRVYEIPESTSRFTPADRESARRATGMRGDPAVLWVGHLDANKDPLTVLAGVGIATGALPGLRLYCCFGVAPLRHAVEARIAHDPRLCDRVQLLGRVPHEQVESLMRAADLFVLGSHREGSGYALIEALACGLPPVVTDIPSFRALTGAGTVGRLWPRGSVQGLATALQSATACSGEDQRRAVRAHFDRELSFAALGSKLAAMYRDVLLSTRRADWSSSGSPACSGHAARSPVP